MNWGSVILDLVLLGIIAFAAWRGWKQGLVMGAVGTVALILCICVGSVVSDAYGEEFTSVPKSVGSGLIDSYITKLQAADYAEVTEDDEKLVVRLTAEQKKDVYMMSYAVSRQLGFSENVSADLAQQAADETDSVNEAMSEVLSSVIWGRVTHVVIFCIIFILCFIVLEAVRNSLDLYLALPGLEIVNRIAGAVLGALQGVILVLLIATVLRYTGVLLKQPVTDKALFASGLIEKNTISNILGF